MLTVVWISAPYDRNIFTASTCLCNTAICSAVLISIVARSLINLGFDFRNVNNKSPRSSESISIRDQWGMNAYLLEVETRDEEECFLCHLYNRQMLLAVLKTVQFDIEREKEQWERASLPCRWSDWDLEYRTRATWGEERYVFGWRCEHKKIPKKMNIFVDDDILLVPRLEWTFAYLRGYVNIRTSFQ